MPWLIPSAVLVAALALFGASVGSLNLDITRYFGACLFFLSLATIVLVIKRALAGGRAIEALRDVAGSLPFVLLAGVAMPAYNSVKTTLNAGALWADPLLAKIDLALFPWLYIEALNVDAAVATYNVGWILFLAATIVALGLRSESAARSRLILAHFLLWCAIAPLVQWMLPSGGPIFYQRLGHGDLFAAYPFNDYAIAASDYLWSFYARGEQGLTSGISAMPSLHIASSAWAVLVWRGTRFYVPSLVILAVLFVLSVSLGWHYALDGIVGGLLALAAYRLAPILLARPARQEAHI